MLLDVIDLRNKKDIEKATKAANSTLAGVLSLVMVAGIISFGYGIYILAANFFAGGGTSVINDGFAMTVGADKIASRPTWWPFVVIGIIVMGLCGPFFYKENEKDENNTKEAIIKDFLAQPAIAGPDTTAYTAIRGVNLKTKKTELHIDLLMVSGYSVSIVNFRDMDKKLYKGTLNLAEIYLLHGKLPFSDCPASFESYENKKLDFWHSYDRAEYRELVWQLRVLLNVIMKEKHLPVTFGEGSLKGFVITPYTKEDYLHDKELDNAEKWSFNGHPDNTPDEPASTMDKMLSPNDGYYLGVFSGWKKTDKTLEELASKFGDSHIKANTMAYTAMLMHKNDKKYPTLDQAVLELFGSHSSTQDPQKKQKNASILAELDPSNSEDKKTDKSNIDDLFD